MIRMTVVKWLAAAAIGLSVPTVGLSQHADSVGGAEMSSVGASSALSTGTTSVTKTKHHSKKLSHTRSHAKHKALHSHHHKPKKLTATSKHVAA